MVRQTLSNRATLLNREESWLKFNWRVLEEAGLLRHTKQGRSRIYEVDRERLGLVREWLGWFADPEK